MPIILMDPREWKDLGVNVVQIDSDAQDNQSAIVEIDEWASQNGFERVNEYWLRRIHRDGKMIFRGICYRPGSDEIASRQQFDEEFKNRLNSMTRTQFKPT